MNEPRILRLKPGKVVYRNGDAFSIVANLDFYSVLGKNIGTGRTEKLLIAELKETAPKPVDEAELARNTPDLMLISDERWETAQYRYQVILPLLTGSGRSRADVEARAKEFGESATTLYRWIAKFQYTGNVSSLMRVDRSDQNKSRLDDKVEAIIKSAIETHYLKYRESTINSTYKIIAKQCLDANLDKPSPNTLRNRIAALNHQDKIKKRGNKNEIHKLRPLKGSFPDVDYPYQMIQIDHTKIDLMLVDDHSRLPVGRPYITLAIDVYSRMVAGFYLTFDPPSAFSVAMCLSHAILPKTSWLIDHEIVTDWPAYGIMENVHLDNAKEFRGKALERGALEHGININFRPVKTPHYGGHIERLNGTLAKAIHELPGTTFSNTAQKGDYDAEAKANMSISEFERWLTLKIVDDYHNQVHSQLGTTPLERYKLGIMGNDERPGRGYPSLAIDEQRLRLDFMPFEMRTIQNYGVVVNHIYYYSDVLRPWINAPKSDTSKQRQEFMFRYDPRDMSKLYFYDPQTREYHEVPYRDLARPPLSIWEVKAAVRRMKEDKTEVDESALFATHEKMRQIVEEAAHKTKKARKDQQRKRDTLRKPPVNLASKVDSADEIESSPSQPSVRTYKPLMGVED